MPNHQPKSRRPDSYPAIVRDIVASAISAEVLVPFETGDAVKRFQKLLTDIRRSYREHGFANWECVNALRAEPVSTIDIRMVRPSYEADINKFPFTLVISPGNGFIPNLQAAHIVEHHTNLPPPPEGITDLNLASLEQELEQIVHEPDPDDADVELIDLIRGRTRG
jgi:hypothetical protein